MPQQPCRYPGRCYPDRGDLTCARLGPAELVGMCPNSENTISEIQSWSHAGRRCDSGDGIRNHDVRKHVHVMSKGPFRMGQMSQEKVRHHVMISSLRRSGNDARADEKSRKREIHRRGWRRPEDEKGTGIEEGV